MQGIKMKNTEGVFVTVPMASRKYKLTTIPKSNDKGSWFVPNVELVGIVEDAAEYRAAVDFRNAVRSGAAQVKHDQAGGAYETEGEAQF